MNTPEVKTAARRADMHRIGAVAERVGLSLRTVRYYEEMGLIAPRERTEGGFRLYAEENVERLLLIKQMKPLGFSVQEMRDLLEARDALRALPPDGPGREAAAARLARFAHAADERCRKLREHLATGEKLARRLARESGRDLTR